MVAVLDIGPGNPAGVAFITAGPDPLAASTRGAAEEAERVNARIELIDGHRLAGLMVQYGVGLQPESTVTLYEVDEDFFENL